MNPEEFEILIRARNEFAQAFKVAHKELGVLEKDIKKLENVERGSTMWARELARRHGELAGTVKKSATEFNRLNDKLRDTVRAQGTLPGFEKLKTNLSPMISQVRQLDEAVDSINSEPVSELQRSFEDLTPQEIDALTASVDRVDQSISALRAHVDQGVVDGMIRELREYDAIAKRAGDTTSRKLIKEIIELKPTADQAGRSLDQLKRKFGSLKDAHRPVDRASQSMGRFGIRTNFTMFQLLRFGAAIAGVRLGISVLATTIISLRNAVIGFNSDVETWVIQFETLIGSTDQAKVHLERLFDFAASTPFQTTQLVEASRQLEVFGGAALNNIDMITLLGDTASATGGDFKNVAFWVGRFYGALSDSRPLGEALARFQELGIITPAVRSEIEGMAEDGAALQDIWEVLTTELESFEGTMAKQGETWKGLASTMSDNAKRLLAGAFKPLFEFVKTLFVDINAFLTDPTTQRNIRKWGVWFTEVLTEFRAWLEIHVPEAINVFKEILASVSPIISIVAGWFGFLVGILSDTFKWLGSNAWAVQILVGAYIGFKIKAITLALLAKSAAWRANAVNIGLSAAALKTFRGAMVSTGIGALLVGLGFLITWVASNWDKSRELMVKAANGIIGAIEVMVNKVIEGLDWLVRKGADKLGDFLELLEKIPEKINPLSDELASAREAVNRFAQGSFDPIILDRIDEYIAKVHEAEDAVDELFDPFADLPERPFGDLLGDFGGDEDGAGAGGAGKLSGLEKAINSIRDSIRDLTVETFLEDGVKKARQVAAEQLVILKQAFDKAAELQELFGFKIEDTIVKVFQSLQSTENPLQKIIADLQKLGDEVVLKDLVEDIERYRDVAREAGDTTALALIDNFLELEFTVDDASSALGALKDRLGEIKDMTEELKGAFNDLRSSTISDINMMGGLLETALTRQAQGVLDRIISGQEAERDALKDLSKQSKDIVAGAQFDMTASVHAGTQARIQAILSESNALKTGVNAELAEIQQRLDELNTRDFEHQLEMIDREMRLAFDPREMQKLLDKREQVVRREEQEQLKERQKTLQSQLKSEDKVLVDEFKSIIDDRTAVLDRAKEQAQKSFDEATDAFNLQSKIRTMLLNGEVDEMGRLLDEFVPEWRTAGLSYGQQLIDGIRSSGIEAFLQNMLGNLGSVQAGIPGITGGGPGSSRPGSSVTDAEIAAAQVLGARLLREGANPLTVQHIRDAIREQGAVPSFREGGFARTPTLAIVGDRPGGEHIFGNDQLRQVIREEVKQNVGVRVFIGDRELTDIVRVEIENDNDFQMGRGARLAGGRT